MAILSTRHRYLFIQVPRTGCTAIGEKVLMPLLGGEPLPAEEVRGPSGELLVPRKHASLGQLLDHGILSQEQRRPLLVFAGVRNPFDSVVSQYTKMRGVNVGELDRPESWVHGQPHVSEAVAYAREHSFDDWVEWQYGEQSWRRRVRRALSIAPRVPMYYVGVDAVVRFERLQEDFADVLRRLGVDDELEVPVFNRTPGRPQDYRDHYTERSRRIVEQAFDGVLHHFDYRF